MIFNLFIAVNDYNFGAQMIEVTAVTFMPCRQIKRFRLNLG